MPKYSALFKTHMVGLSWINIPFQSDHGFYICWASTTELISLIRLDDLDDLDSVTLWLNVYITMERSTIFHGKIHYFNWAMASIANCWHNQRVWFTIQPKVSPFQPMAHGVPISVTEIPRTCQVVVARLQSVGPWLSWSSAWCSLKHLGEIINGTLW